MKNKYTNPDKDFNQSNFFTTSETALAAYLYSEGFEIVDVEIGYNGKPSEFLFDDSEKLQEFTRDFRTFKAIGNVAQYHAAYRKCLIMVKRGKI